MAKRDGAVTMFGSLKTFVSSLIEDGEATKSK
jgi:hypothetical protein